MCVAVRRMMLYARICKRRTLNAPPIARDTPERAFNVLLYRATRCQE